MSEQDKRDWKPGSVAFVDSWRGKGQIAFRTLRGDIFGWCVLDEIDTRGLHDDEVNTARPVVVIDPEDREQVEWLADLNERATPDGLVTPTASTDAMQAALREFANPTPPKPDEPTEIGSIVVDSDGEKWVRHATGEWSCLHSSPHLRDIRTWDELCAQYAPIEVSA